MDAREKRMRMKKDNRIFYLWVFVLNEAKK